MDQNYDIPLHDIKPLVEIQEYSMEYLIAINVVLIIIIMAFLYILFKWFQDKKKYNERKEHFKILENLDMNDTKNTAYKLTLYGYTFKDDTPRHQKAYNELFENLQRYEYKKEVESFDSETLHFIEIYQGMIDA
jgi:N-acetyl-anhydromuramyl-L-alanine amidase AmpD